LNFLAHQFLSGNDEQIRVGNFIADFVKGKKYRDFEEGIRIGILLHREIDWFTDNHAIIRSLNSDLRIYFGKYAGVATDVYFDHFLAKEWGRLSNIALAEYSQETYEIMAKYKSVLPERTRHMLKYMKRDDWLFNYQNVEGVARSLKGIASRTHFESGLEKGGVVLEIHYEQLQNGFRSFLQDILKAQPKLLQSAKAADADSL
jgi:acyl carrier protein phosphodiesterase